MRRQPVDQAADLGQLVSVVDRRDVEVVGVGLLVTGEPDGLRLLGERGGQLVRDAREAITRVAAVQSCPALKNPAIAIASAAAARSASSNTTTGALPPSSRCARATFLAVAAATARPAAVEPVIATIAGIGCEASAEPVDRSPHTTLSTPGGRISANSSPIRTVLAGVVSEGLRTSVFPAASAGPIFQVAIIIG